VPAQQSIFGPIRELFVWMTTLISISFEYSLSLVADHGYRPEKVVWWVLLILVASFSYFWFRLKIVAFRPEQESGPLPVGFTFLFDRLLPAYQIREDHYKIREYLQRVPKGIHKDDPRGREFEYLRMSFYVIPADDKLVQRAERALDVLKFLGLVLAVFLVAALNALVHP
jgi:hypothetical protein